MTDLREAAQMALPCPFCGGKDISTHEGSSFRWHVAECMTCGAQGSEVRRQTVGQGTTDLWIKQAAADAIAEWNTRAALAQPEQPEQEPVGNTLTFMTRAIFNIVADHHEINGGYFIADGDVAAFVDRLAKVINSTFEPLKHKGSAPPQRECAGTAHDRREWQGLTDDDFIGLTTQQIFAMKFAEAKLKKENS